MYHRFNHVVHVNRICVVMSCLEMDVGNFYEQFRGIFNVSLSRAQYDTLFTERDKLKKACDAKVA